MSAVWELPAVRAGMDRQTAARERMQRTGASLVGWKVGVGAPAAMEAAGIPAALVGFLTSRTVIDDGVSVPVAGWVRPMLEPEIAIHLGADLPGDADLEEATAAIAAIGPAIELADVDTELSDLTRVVGGDIFHRAVVLGPSDAARRGGVVDDLRVTVLRGEEVIARTDDVTALTGPPAELVLHVARWLHAAGQQLRAGQVVIGGSVVPIIPVAPGDAVTYRCEPLGDLAVTFTT